MDSGNSGSVQSSSGGDNEEYDSRVDTISPFFNPSLSFGPISNHPQPPPPPPSPPPLFRHQSNTFFDLSTQNLDTFTHSQPNPNANPLYNLDTETEQNGGYLIGESDIETKQNATEDEHPDSLSEDIDDCSGAEQQAAEEHRQLPAQSSGHQRRHQRRQQRRQVQRHV
ncbi:hypothetical protein U1Q18_008247 [Sarracenia purpurea var. burkii]